MVLLAASITTRGGKPVISRQFREMAGSRIESLLASFPKLINSGSQHTFVETDSVRYVYQPLEDLYMILITTKNSNILQDIDTLHLLARAVSDQCHSLDEHSVLLNAFEILEAFDEIVALGYRENVTLSQVRTMLEMDSHEERIHEIIERNKELEAKEELKRRARQLEMQRRDAARRQHVGMGNDMYQQAKSYDTPTSAPVHSMPEAQNYTVPAPLKGKGMLLAKKPKGAGLLGSMQKDLGAKKVSDRRVPSVSLEAAQVNSPVVPQSPLEPIVIQEPVAQSSLGLEGMSLTTKKNALHETSVVGPAAPSEQHAQPSLLDFDPAMDSGAEVHSVIKEKTALPALPKEESLFTSAAQDDAFSSTNATYTAHEVQLEDNAWDEELVQPEMAGMAEPLVSETEPAQTLEQAYPLEGMHETLEQETPAFETEEQLEQYNPEPTDVSEGQAYAHEASALQAPDSEASESMQDTAALTPGLASVPAMQAHKDPLLPTEPTPASPTVPSMPPSVPHTSEPSAVTENVQLVLKERVSMTGNRDGGLDSLEIKGDLLLKITDPEVARLSLNVVAQDQFGGAEVQYRTHPHVDKAAWGAERKIALRDPRRPFPLHQQVGVLRWRVVSNDETKMPLSITVWISPMNDGAAEVNVEYELEALDLTLTDVTFAVPIPAGSIPEVQAPDEGMFEFDAANARVLWRLDSISAANPSANVELAVQSGGDDADAFFPVSIDFTGSRVLSGLQMAGVVAAETGAPIPFAARHQLAAENYLVR
ncbi:coatomer subunit delta [Malassezia vespertilionis]|uniref:Coatomer subunit delta n=1 Tax=Malassezia vespertilionis TaxID=2020962 RepID=A0A2N1J957_9BASI|nr:coatomer subunit delta [Malassezia vespertilionis]PKI83076.1 hypothetical protein MVES_002753 [Malassezia vespertilionis]WFD07537.1 coatomer subunit delta [Malassezia vespertilionis]